MIGLSFLLIKPSFFEAANGISPASMFRCLSRRADLSLASPVAFFSGDEAEIAILQPLRNCSFEAYEATAEESKDCASGC